MAVNRPVSPNRQFKIVGWIMIIGHVTGLLIADVKLWPLKDYATMFLVSGVFSFAVVMVYLALIKDN